ASPGVIAALVVPKQAMPQFFESDEAGTAVRTGFVALHPLKSATRIQLLAVGAYQLEQAQLAAEALAAAGCQAQVVAVLEPGRLRGPRAKLEPRFVLTDARVAAALPANRPRFLLCHGRPGPLGGAR